MGGLFSCVALGLCECAVCMGCKCLSGIINVALSQAARFGHLLLLITVFVIAIIIGKEFPDQLDSTYSTNYAQVNLDNGCSDSFENNCIYRQLIYRSSFALFVTFFLLAVGSFFSNYVNRSLWSLKFMLAIGLFIAFLWGENNFFSGYAEFARVISFFWLLVQGLLLLDFSHDLHDITMKEDAEASDESNSNFRKIVYLLLSIGSFACAIVGIVFLFMNYTDCQLGMFFTVLTVIVGVLTTIISLLEVVGKGLLTPGLMFAYSVFMCW